MKQGWRELDTGRGSPGAGSESRTPVRCGADRTTLTLVEEVESQCARDSRAPQKKKAWDDVAKVSGPLLNSLSSPASVAGSAWCCYGRATLITDSG
ncbi:hypothetical protein O3P69_018306 [Scylla paramamosain]|uniref:Uncharacterized protein n=1 Tax=Scylla paramamosain TaxID=85552 RepID=A0AAW0TJ30_SCYPA